MLRRETTFSCTLFTQGKCGSNKSYVSHLEGDFVVSIKVHADEPDFRDHIKCHEREGRNFSAHSCCSVYSSWKPRIVPQSIFCSHRTQASDSDGPL